MLVWLLIGCSFMLMLVRIGLPFGIKSEGSVVATVTLTYREKLLLHRTDLYALGALLVLGAIGKWFPTTVELVIILVALALINLPVRYQFTTVGIACNNVLFRKWKEFEYARYRGAKLTLVPRKSFGAIPLFVLASRQDEIFPYLQRILQVRNEEPPKCLSYDGDELHDLWPRHDRLLHLRFRLPVWRRWPGRNTQPWWSLRADQRTRHSDWRYQLGHHRV